MSLPPPACASVTWLDPETGWRRANIERASYSGVETKTVVLDLDSAISGRVRLIVSGTGPTPLLGADLVPLAGAVGGPPGTPHDGHDFVHMRDFVPVVTEPDEVTQPEELSEMTRVDLGQGAKMLRGSTRGKVRRSKSPK